MELLLLITIIALAAILILRDLQKNDLWNSRFIELPTILNINLDQEEENEYSDSLLVQLTKDSKVDMASESRGLTISTVIDMEEIKGYDEHSTNKLTDKNIYSDSTFLEFYDGSFKIIIIPFEEFDIIFNNFLNNKKKYINLRRVYGNSPK